MTVDWSTERSSTYPACVRIDCLDRVGIAADILKKVSDNRVNLRDLKVETNKERKTASIVLIVEVIDIDQLQKVSQAISQISDVIRVHRPDHRKKPAAKTSRSNNVTVLKPNVKLNSPNSKNRSPNRKPRAHSGD